VSLLSVYSGVQTFSEREASVGQCVFGRTWRQINFLCRHLNHEQYYYREVWRNMWPWTGWKVRPLFLYETARKIRGVSVV